MTASKSERGREKVKIEIYNENLKPISRAMSRNIANKIFAVLKRNRKSDSEAVVCVSLKNWCISI